MQDVQPLRRKRALEAASNSEAASVAEPDDADVPSRPAFAPVVGIERPGVAAPAAAIARVDAVHLGPLASLALRCALVVTTVGATGIALLWILASATGMVGRTESFMQSIGFRDFDVSGTRVIAGTLLVVAGVTLALATCAVVAGAGYNLFAMHGKGLRVGIAVIALDPAGTTTESTPPSEASVAGPVTTTDGCDPAA